MKEEKKVEKKMQPCMTCGQDKKGEKKRECYNSHLMMKERRFTSLEKKEEKCGVVDGCFRKLWRKRKARRSPFFFLSALSISMLN